MGRAKGTHSGQCACLAEWRRPRWPVAVGASWTQVLLAGCGALQQPWGRELEDGALSSPAAFPALVPGRDLADSGSSGRTSDFGLGERQQWALRDSGPGGPQGGRRGRGHRGRVSGLPERPGPLEGTSAALDVMVLVAGCPHALTRGSGRLEEQALVTAGMEALGDRFCVTAGHR